MMKVNYTSIANELLGNELYCKFLKEIAKENKGMNLCDFGKEVMEKCCFLIVMLGTSKNIKLDNIKICLENETIDISCKEFAEKYKTFVTKVESSIIETI